MTNDKTIEELIEQPEHMPIAAMYREAIKAQHQELIKLRERLEITDELPYDGIYCRDATIEGQEKYIDRLREEKRVLREALYEVAYCKIQTEQGLKDEKDDNPPWGIIGRDQLITLVEHQRGHAHAALEKTGENE